MIRLLSAGFPRLKKEKIFWIGVGFMAIAAFFIVRSEHQMMLHYETEPSIENVVTGYCQFAGIFAAAVCNYASNVQGFDKTAFCKTFSAAMNALYRKQGKKATLDDFEVQANFNVLAEADPDALSEQDKAEIKTAAEYFLSAFSLFREN